DGGRPHLGRGGQVLHQGRHRVRRVRADGEGHLRVRHEELRKGGLHRRVRALPLHPPGTLRHRP
ncbi:unnamed protein product, partial [Ectocarpus sp. 8 AP-2014]